jgi:hypothetical protein
MFIPVLSSRVKEWNQLTGLWIDRRNVRAFVGIASIAGQCPILRRSCTVVLFSPDVIDLERCERECDLWQPAILANAIGALPN